MTPLTVRLEQYLAVRRSLGYDLSFSERVLRRFTAWSSGGRRHDKNRASGRRVVVKFPVEGCQVDTKAAIGMLR
jgi:hypothetical protein